MAVITLTRPSSASPKQPRFPQSAVAITPSDTDTFSVPVTVYVGSTGDVVVTPAGQQDDVTFTVVSGQVIPLEVWAVKATGTTATGLVAIY